MATNRRMSICTTPLHHIHCILHMKMTSASVILMNMTSASVMHMLCWNDTVKHITAMYCACTSNHDNELAMRPVYCIRLTMLKCMCIITVRMHEQGVLLCMCAVCDEAASAAHPQQNTTCMHWNMHVEGRLPTSAPAASRRGIRLALPVQKKSRSAGGQQMLQEKTMYCTRKRSASTDPSS